MSAPGSASRGVDYVSFLKSKLYDLRRAAVLTSELNQSASVADSARLFDARRERITSVQVAIWTAEA
jgi:hypothetical protein